MGLDYRPADREPHPHAEWFGRYERLEDRVRHLGGDPWSSFARIAFSVRIRGDGG